MTARVIILSRGRKAGDDGLPVLDASGRAWLAATPPAQERGSHAQAESANQ